MHTPRPLALLLAVLCIGHLTSSSSARLTPSNASSTGSTATASVKRIPVVIDQDGGVEDLVAIMLLMLDPRVDLLMVSYIEADSIKDVAVNTTLKLMHFLNKFNTPLAVSTLEPKNSFPLLYRAGPLAADVLPALNPPDLQLESLGKRLVAQQPGQDALLQLLLKQQEPVTIIATGPLTNIAYALKKNPAVADKISSIWWMGGTLRHPGNIFNNSNSDGTAEWNVFADPQAAAVVWDSKVPVTLVPLDATNKVPITQELLYKFGKQHTSKLSSLVGGMYAPTILWVYLAPYDPYYAWDTLNAACFLEPSICKMQQETVSIALEGTAQGATLLAQSPRVTAESSKVASKALVLSKPKKVAVAADADASKFDSYMLKAFAG